MPNPIRLQDLTNQAKAIHWNSRDVEDLWRRTLIYLDDLENRVDELSDKVNELTEHSHTGHVVFEP